MGTLQTLIDTYGNKDCRDLGSRQLEALRNNLKNINSDEIKTCNDGLAYINLLKKFRTAIAENDKLHGDNYPNMLKSLLSVGEDGLYSNNLRFIFELIQNVDDCDFNSLDDCKLDMKFEFEDGKIILSYNEKGFTPFNIFAITGIAEAAKNISAQKNEIGEKGIGFKSVFGVANKVLIRSGWFSFELSRDNFTIPNAAYNDKSYCSGTEMTLFVTFEKSIEIYNQLKSQYCSKDAVFSKNPILFLNKLTELKMYFDCFRSMRFCVTRSFRDHKDEFSKESDVIISVDLNDYENGVEKKYKQEITCTRYFHSVNYNHEACQSRYGDNSAVGSNGGKRMILQMVIPSAEDVKLVGNGALYSFLPTQLHFNVPIVCHVPFKLDASREFVDPQDENIWFKKSCSFLSELVDYSITDWSKTAKSAIIDYIPEVDTSLFQKNNGKELCLYNQKCFLGKHFSELPIFFTADNNFFCANEIFSFDPAENISEPETVYLLMNYNKELFLLPVNESSRVQINLQRYGIHIEQNAHLKLFKYALESENVTCDALNYLDSINYEYKSEHFSKERISLSKKQVKELFRHKKLLKIFQEVACECISKNQRPPFIVNDVSTTQLSDLLNLELPDFSLDEAPESAEKYLSFCDESCHCIDIDKDNYLACYNALVLSKTNALASFASFCHSIDSNDIFAIRVKLRQASIQLDKYEKDETISNDKYLKCLRDVRLIVKDSLGQKGYKNYIDLILKSGTDNERFIQELLQNADDCEYSVDATPAFSLYKEGTTIVAEYNEVGFTCGNVRAITAIGESTKNKLLNGKKIEIGEKGIGFKTIFSVASEVKVFSHDICVF